jgi:hypothetical protein
MAWSIASRCRCSAGSGRRRSSGSLSASTVDDDASARKSQKPAPEKSNTSQENTRHRGACAALVLVQEQANEGFRVELAVGDEIGCHPFDILPIVLKGFPRSTRSRDS